MLPFAPERLSMRTGCFQTSVSFCPMMRARKSEVPPVGYGMIQRIGFEGYSCASSAAGANDVDAASAISASREYLHNILPSRRMIDAPTIEQERTSNGR